jgi:F420-dependent oxidoreductase-like protein
MARFGLQLPNFTLGGGDDAIFPRVLELAIAGEEAGFSSLWVMDHLYQLPALGGADQPMLEAYTLLGALAARTSRAELGTLVTGVTYRNPALLAKELTTVDVISGGRAVLGIGAAWHDIEHVAFGYDFPSAGERLDRLEEAVQICRAMFTEPSVTFHGRYYHVEALQNVPRPLRPGGPQIMIGGGGERRTLALVARYADRCNVSGDLDAVRHKLDVLSQHCRDVGRDPATITTTRLGSLFLAPSQSAAEETRRMLIDMAGEEFAAGATIGTADDVTEQVAAILDAGIDEPIFNMPYAPADTVREVGALLSERFATVAD